MRELVRPALEASATRVIRAPAQDLHAIRVEVAELKRRIDALEARGCDRFLVRLNAPPNIRQVTKTRRRLTLSSVMRQRCAGVGKADKAGKRA